MNPTTLVPPAAVAALRRTVAGPVAYPSDPAYDELVSGHNLAVRHRPVVAVVALDEADVAAAVDVARTHALPVHVQSTGHGAHAPVEGGLLLLTHRMDRIVLDPDAGTATVGAGVTWGALSRAAATIGRAAVTTSGADIGVVGSLLGGGLGPQSRLHGLCSDHVLSLRVVGADGFVHVVESGTELACALLGGRDGFGVVVGVTLRLAGTHRVWGGTVTSADPRPALAAWRTWSGQLPDTMSTTAVLTTSGGTQVLRVTACDTDPQTATERLTGSPFALAGPSRGRCTADEWLTTYGEAPGAEPSWRRGHLLRELPPDVDDLLLDASAPGTGVDVEIRRLGGRLDGPPCHSTDLAGASHLVALRVTTEDGPDPADDAAAVAAIADVSAALRPWLAPASMLNFHGVTGVDHPLERCWSEPTRELLSATRRAGDPAGVFARPADPTGDHR